MAAASAGQGQGLLPSARQASQKAANPLLKAGQEAKLKDAARLYEAHFLATLWKEMRKSSPKGGLTHGGYGEDIFTGLLDQSRADASAGRGGLGIARMLESQLTAPGRSAAPRASSSQLKPLAWRGKVPATEPPAETDQAESTAAPLLDPDPEEPLIEFAPTRAQGDALSAVTLPMPQDEEGEESAMSAQTPAPAAQAPLVRGAAAAALMEPPVMGAVTSTFGLRLHPITGDIRPHQGLDLAAPSGAPIKATLAGVVRFAGQAGDYGRLVVVEHDDGSSAFYGHCKSLSVTPGQRVAQGQMIARVGMSGLATGPHLHFELRDAGGRATDPLPMLAGRLNSTS